MHPKTPKWLEDIVDYAGFILDQAAERTLTEYEGNRLVRSAVERGFEIVGEALLRIERTDPVTAARIIDYRQIIGFRNRLVQGTTRPITRWSGRSSGSLCRC